MLTCNFIVLAMQTNGYALDYVSAQFKGDHDIVLAAVNNARRALRFANVTKKARKRLLRAGPKETRFLFRHMPFPYNLPDELVEMHILPHAHRM